MVSSLHIPQTADEYDQATRYNPIYDILGKPSPAAYSSVNEHATTAFSSLAHMRTSAISMFTSKINGAVPFLYLDRASAIEPIPTEEEKAVTETVFDFNQLTSSFQGNRFYDRAHDHATTLFRTCLGTYPVDTDNLGINAGRIGEMLNLMLSPTPLDFATAGALDRCPEGSSSNPFVVMTTEFVDPHLDLVYDIDGKTWEFDAELHAVASRYTHLREIWDIFQSRSGIATKSHFILIAALRLAALLEALEPLSIREPDDDHDSDASVFDVRGYLLAVINAAWPFIRLYAFLRNLVPDSSGIRTIAFNQVPHIDSSNTVVWVHGSEYRDRVNVVTDGSLKHLIIKSIIEGSRKLDTSLEPKGATGKRFSEFANNEATISVFLTCISFPDFWFCGNAMEKAKELKTFIALSTNAPGGFVRPSLISRNNGLKSGIDSMLERIGIDQVTQLFSNLRTEDIEKTTMEIEAIQGMDEFGVTDDHAVEHLGTSALGVSSANLYDLQYPAKSSWILRRRKKVIGKIVVANGKFSFKKGGKGAIGLLTVFEIVKGVQVMGNGVSVDFNSKQHDSTAIVNACLSNVFGWEAAIFVLEHMLLGSVSVSEGCTTPGYLTQATASPNGVRITSFLHPVVTEKLAFYKGIDDGSYYFDTKTVVRRQKVEIDGDVATLASAEDGKVVYEGTAKSIGRKYLA